MGKIVEKLEDTPTPGKYPSGNPKVYAFNPPTAGSHQDSERTNRALGMYYSKLGMRRSDVDKRTRAMDKTGRDYLNVVRSYEQDREASKGKTASGIRVASMRDFDKL